MLRYSRIFGNVRDKNQKEAKFMTGKVLKNTLIEKKNTRPHEPAIKSAELHPI